MNTHRIFNKKVYKKIPVYEVEVPEFDIDPEINLAEQLLEWRNSDRGRFVMERSASQPTYHKVSTNYEKFVVKFAVMAELEEKHISEYYLRWGTFI